MTGIEHSPAGPMPLAGWPERFFHGFLESAPDAVVIVDGGGAIVQVNSQAERLFGYTRVELLGCPLEVLMPERFRGSHVAHRHGYSVDMHPRPYLALPRPTSRGSPKTCFFRPLTSRLGSAAAANPTGEAHARRSDPEDRARFRYGINAYTMKREALVEVDGKRADAAFGR